MSIISLNNLFPSWSPASVNPCVVMLMHLMPFSAQSLMCPGTWERCHDHGQVDRAFDVFNGGVCFYAEYLCGIGIYRVDLALIAISKQILQGVVGVYTGFSRKPDYGDRFRFQKGLDALHIIHDATFRREAYSANYIPTLFCM